MATKWVCIMFLLLTLPVPWGSVKTSAACELVQTLFSTTPKKNGKKRSGHARLDPTYGEASDIKRRTKIQLQLLHHFWNRWSKEYLTALCEFHRVSGTNTQTVKSGDVILIYDDSPRINWRLAVVE